MAQGIFMAQTRQGIIPWIFIDPVNKTEPGSIMIQAPVFNYGAEEGDYSSLRAASSFWRASIMP
jgi:hypothetical protein